MLLSKYKDKTGKTRVTLVVSSKFLSQTKNPEFFRIDLKEDFEIGLDEKKTIKLNELIDLNKLVENTLKDKK